MAPLMKILKGHSTCWQHGCFLRECYPWASFCSDVASTCEGRAASDTSASHPPMPKIIGNHAVQNKHFNVCRDVNYQSKHPSSGSWICENLTKQWRDNVMSTMTMVEVNDQTFPEMTLHLFQTFANPPRLGALLNVQRCHFLSHPTWILISCKWCATLTPCYLHFHQRKQNGMEDVKIRTILLGHSIPSSISSLGPWGPVWLPCPPQSLPPSCQVTKTPKKQQLKTGCRNPERSNFFHISIKTVFLTPWNSSLCTLLGLEAWTGLHSQDKSGL